MGRIFYIMGKSATGKDTYLRKLLSKAEPDYDGGSLYHPSHPGGRDRRGGVFFYFVRKTGTV